jgi:hypothetical protein
MLPSQVGARRRLLPLGVSVKAGSARTPLVSVTAIARVLFSASVLLIRCALFASFSQPRISANMVSFVLHASAMLSSCPGFGETTFVYSW